MVKIQIYPVTINTAKSELFTKPDTLFSLILNFLFVSGICYSTNP